MKNYDEIAESVNAYDYATVKEGAAKEVANAIKAWRECGKPNMPEYLEDLDVVLHPYNNDGKLAFVAYVYEVDKESFEEYKAGAESLDEVVECDIEQMTWDEQFPGEVFGDGHFFVHTNIDFK